MTTLRHTRRQSAFTLIELLIVMGLVAIVLTLAAPSFRNMIEMQRLRGTSGQIVTDIQFARSEAATRQQPVFVTFASMPGSRSCYTVHTCGALAACRCNCTATPACPNATWTELRTVVVPAADGVNVGLTATPGEDRPSMFAFDPATGGLTPFLSAGFTFVPMLNNEVWIDAALIRGGATGPRLRTALNRTGRPSGCSVNGGISGVAAC